MSRRHIIAILVLLIVAALVWGASMHRTLIHEFREACAELGGTAVFNGDVWVCLGCQ